MSSMLHPEYKVVMLGSGGVGKSMLTTKYMNGTFSDEYDPTIEDSYRKKCTVDDDTCVLEILDTAGQEEYAAMRDYHIRSGDCFVVVYSVADAQTLYEAEVIAKKIYAIKDVERVPIVLVGNKCDLAEREVTTREGTEMARRIHSGFYEASARDNIRVVDVFTQCVRRIKRLRKEIEPQSAGQVEEHKSNTSRFLKQSKALGGTRSWIQRRKFVKETNDAFPTHQSLPEYYMGARKSTQPQPPARASTVPTPQQVKRKTTETSATSTTSKRRSTGKRGVRPGESTPPNGTNHSSGHSTNRPGPPYDRGRGRSMTQSSRSRSHSSVSAGRAPGPETRRPNNTSMSVRPQKSVGSLKPLTSSMATNPHRRPSPPRPSNPSRPSNAPRQINTSRPANPHRPVNPPRSTDTIRRRNEKSAYDRIKYRDEVHVSQPRTININKELPRPRGKKAQQSSACTIL
ncbi:ras-domain-containing protein [Coemansia reversa NRRL 1564]|uniref:Ras-domain-containing protein n=1 Tax=Coemansia reversa (strain ATCC 12441 / NRRL 1564) TaxID=763665 RepID=A0A2G5BJW9_COERN|nr:ras-domain-containing protein [Coemansia reversa NRRL 1564]|eukprot:PIA19308.1 ras-domain-containing protein [Coemansia reversa NRRL 1564]